MTLVPCPLANIIISSLQGIAPIILWPLPPNFLLSVLYIISFRFKSSSLLIKVKSLVTFTLVALTKDNESQSLGCLFKLNLGVIFISF